MLVSAQPVNDNIARLVDRLIKEEQRYEQDKRSVHRTPFVRPVTIYLSDDGGEIAAFSKNISAGGIGLLISQPIEAEAKAKLEIHALRGAPLRMLSESRWCHEFGNGWYLSGWRFINELR